MSNYAVELKNITKIFRIDTRNHKLRRELFLDKQKNVSAKAVSKNFLRALDDVSFYARKGEVLGIIGLNGSGKSTLLQVISGIYQPDSGDVRINGTLAPILRLGTGFNEELFPSENIVLFGILLGIPKKTIESKVNSILEFAELSEFLHLKLKHFSSGMKARLGFSTVLQLNPDILLIDEILSVGDIKFRKKSFEAFLGFKEKGKTILLTAHQMYVMKDICDRVLLLDKGKVLMIGDPDEVTKKYQDLNK